MDRRRNDLQPGGASMLHAVILSALCVIVVLAATACTSTQSNLPIQYATMKLIERDAVTPAEVQERVERVRGLVAGGGTLTDLGERVRDAIGYTKLAPSDRLLTDAILGDVAHRVDIGFDAPLGDAQRDAILEALDSIDRVAALY